MVTLQKLIYDWKRFWCPRTGSINLTDSGYLYDPDSQYGKIHNPDVVSYEEISNKRCLGLLGEPGSGKTFAIEEAKEIFHKDKKTMSVDLRSCGSDFTLYRNLFEHQHFQQWFHGDYDMYLFLDSLDECLLGANYLTSVLIEEFKKCPMDRLFLRIISRTADWPSLLETELDQLWEKESVEVFELAPLRLKDVKDAVSKNQLNSEAFLHEVLINEAIPFAIKPITLSILINNYKKDGKFPSTQKEIYLIGCRSLCEEIGGNQLNKKEQLTSRERLQVASRIAAVTVFSNKYAIWRGLDFGNVFKEDVTIQELSYGGQLHLEESLVEKESNLVDTLSTGLFTSRGVNRFGWTHQTYAEFLAAWYLIEKKLSVKQILNLIEHPEDQERKLVPQLHEVSAWLASMSDDIYQEIVKRDPFVLLRSDISNTSNDNKEILVEELLKRLEDGEILKWNFDNQHRYSKLFHPALEEQLKEYIMDGSKSIFAKREAIEIAKSCRLTNLNSIMLDLALNASELLPIREQAAWAVKEIGEASHIKKLLPLANSEIGDDPRDGLKGIALSALWPKYLTVKELLQLLTPKKQKNYFGAYDMFLAQNLISEIHIEDLPFALNWVVEQPSTHALENRFKEFVNHILQKSWDHLEIGNIINPFSKAIFSRFVLFDQLSIFEEIRTTDKRRHALILAMFNNIGDKEEVAEKIQDFQLISATDISWLISCLLSSENKIEQDIWAQLIWNTFDVSNYMQIELIHKVSKETPALEVLSKKSFEPILLNSVEAQKMRERESKSKARKRLIENNKPSKVSFLTENEVSSYLDKIEAGSLDDWWRLNFYMAHNSEGRSIDELNTDLTMLKGWKIVSESTKIRIIEVAKTYILKAIIDENESFKVDVIHRPAFAGYQALSLILKYDADFLSTLSKEVWKKWLPAILVCPISTGSEEEVTRSKIVNLAYTCIPDQVIDLVLILVDRENQKFNYIFIINALEECWDDQITHTILCKLEDDNLAVGSMDSLLRILFKKRVVDAISFTRSFLTNPLPTEEKRRAKTVNAIRELLIHGGDTEWEKAWPIIQKDRAFGHEVMFSIASTMRETSHMGEEILGDLYIWLLEQFPFSGDPDYSNEDMAHFVTPREQIADFRNSLLRSLENRGTLKSCDEIARIIEHFPEDSTWLRPILIEAKNKTRRRTWAPPSPIDIINLTSNKDFRFVQSGEQLLDVIEDSLERFEQKLHGETPENVFLWNDLGEKKFNPRTENEFSDYVKKHFIEDLKGKGIIVNREVEIRKTTGNIQGQRTDLQVDAILKQPDRDSHEIISVIVEVKGNWHSELKTAMETQLVDRYLKNNTCKYGLYLIGWFDSEMWKDENRRRKIPKVSIEEAKIFFDEQAEKLTDNEREVRAYVVDVRL